MIMAIKFNTWQRTKKIPNVGGGVRGVRGGSVQGGVVRGQRYGGGGT